MWPPLEEISMKMTVLIRTGKLIICLAVQTLRTVFYCKILLLLMLKCLWSLHIHQLVAKTHEPKHVSSGGREAA